MNKELYSYEEQRMLSEYQQYLFGGRYEEPQNMLDDYTKKIDAAKSKIAIIINTLFGFLFVTVLTSLVCILEPQMVAVEISKAASHILGIMLFITIKNELDDAKRDIQNATKLQQKLLSLSFDKNVYDFLEEFKFQEKFDMLNVLVYGSQIWSLIFTQLLFFIQIDHQGVLIILWISYIMHMLLIFCGCLFSCFRQNPSECSCTLLKSKKAYQFIYLPSKKFPIQGLESTKIRTQQATVLILFYYVLKFLLFIFMMPSTDEKTQIVIIINLIYCALMIFKQIYQLILTHMIKQVHSKHLICFQSAYMLYYKLFFYDSFINLLWKLAIFMTSIGCILTCFIQNVPNYFNYLHISIYKIEIYIVHDTICFLISIIIYMYYMLEKYTYLASINNIGNLAGNSPTFYSLDKILLNPHFRVLYQHLEIMTKLQLSPYKSFELNENSECVICTEKLKREDQLVGLNCYPTHVFHKECIIKWVLLHTTCPTCRISIE